MLELFFVKVSDLLFSLEWPREVVHEHGSGLFKNYEAIRCFHREHAVAMGPIVHEFCHKFKDHEHDQISLRKRFKNFVQKAKRKRFHPIEEKLEIFRVSHSLADS